MEITYYVDNFEREMEDVDDKESALRRVSLEDISSRFQGIQAKLTQTRHKEAALERKRESIYLDLNNLAYDVSKMQKEREILMGCSSTNLSLRELRKDQSRGTNWKKNDF
ncbi:unnamed protein product [Penicillium pancosmium]